MNEDEMYEARLNQRSVRELNALFRHIPPKRLVNALTKLYLDHFGEEVEHRTELEEFQRPIYRLVVTLRKMRFDRKRRKGFSS